MQAPYQDWHARRATLTSCDARIPHMRTQRRHHLRSRRAKKPAYNATNKRRAVRAFRYLRFNIPDNYKLVSLDVKSLFTYIPKDLVIGKIKLYGHKIRKTTKLPVKEFFELVELCIYNAFCVFQKKYFKQIFGADLVMEKLEKDVLKKLPLDYVFLYRYVNDIFTCVPGGNLDQLLSAFNACDPKLQFTMEVQNQNKLNFFDITFIR